MMKMGKKASALLVAAALLGGSAIGIAAQTPEETAAEAAGNTFESTPPVPNTAIRTAAGIPADKKNTEDASSSKNDTAEPPVGMPNPLVEYESYEAAAEVLGFPPMALPKSSGWQPAAYIVINDEIGELRFERKWEPEVSFTVRTCRLPEGEESFDISGIYGARWWDEEFEEQTVRTAKYGERSYAATWTAGRYVFAAYGENMAYSPFWYLLTEYLLSQTGTYLYLDSPEQEPALNDADRPDNGK